MIVLGISAYYHDSAAALIKDGVVIAAAEEERFNRIKHYSGFPAMACRFCLDYASITLDDVDKVVFYEKPFVKFERILRTHINYAPRGLRTFLSAMPVWLKEKLNMRHTMQKELKREFGVKHGDIEFCHHHLSHAALAYSTSPFERCAVLVVDAVGENATTSIYKASPEGYELLESFGFPHSLGLLYSAVTYYLGFKVNSDEYKVMGLAPYGDKETPEYEAIRQKITTELVEVRDDGSIKLNDRHFSYMYGEKMVSDSEWQKLFGFVRRYEGDAILSHHKNMALAIQDVTEQIMLNMAIHARQISGEENLCVVGGCALNCAAIGKLKLASKPGTVFVPYAPGDDGAAIGCAVYACGCAKQDGKNEDPFLGMVFDDSEVEQVIAENSLTSEHIEDFYRLCEVVARELADSKIVGWFQGRMEFGPRALGNRSILADPRNPKMKDMVNARIKFREAFRPFAPAVIERYASSVFDHVERSPYMSTTFHLNDGETGYPAITHVDNTARIQTVSPHDNTRFYELLDAFHALTGSPLLLNTSFNVMG
ncbi:MAG: carbamoyltransferase, partial [Muribaculaceae bacterium]|nr:carbamoyltransferase [Muribaculaceae bacterium]